MKTPKIVLGVNPHPFTPLVFSCAITGEDFEMTHFHWFFLDGDEEKPVSLAEVLKHGFHCNSEDELRRLVGDMDYVCDIASYNDPDPRHCKKWGLPVPNA